jgi:CTP:molybdopterin cytidylyltransferase MocA
MVPAVILAAGRSSRMGRNKALIRTHADGPTFVSKLSRTLVQGGAPDVIVVGRTLDDALQREVDTLGPSVRFVANTDPDRGQLSSLIAGLNSADKPGVTGILVAPVDAPFVASSTVAALLSSFTSSRAPIVRATYRGRHGHPVIFSRTVFDVLRHADPSQGAKAVVRAHRAALIDLDTDDPGVIDDIDDPDDYAKALDRQR